jgi:hypothetical protein
VANQLATASGIRAVIADARSGEFRQVVKDLLKMREGVAGEGCGVRDGLQE